MALRDEGDDWVTILPRDEADRERAELLTKYANHYLETHRKELVMRLLSEVMRRTHWPAE